MTCSFSAVLSVSVGVPVDAKITAAAEKPTGDSELVRQKKIATSTTAAFRKYSRIKHYDVSVKGESFYTPRLVSVSQVQDKLNSRDPDVTKIVWSKMSSEVMPDTQTCVAVNSICRPVSCGAPSMLQQLLQTCLSVVYVTHGSLSV